MRSCAASADHPAALLAAAVVVAFPARPEFLAGLALEAQAMGAVVIIVEAGAASETILAPPDVERRRADRLADAHERDGPCRRAARGP